MSEKYPNCTHVLRAAGRAYSRTCQECGLGPCKRGYGKGAPPTGNKIREALNIAIDCAEAEVARLAEAYGNRLQHKQQIARDELRVCKEALAALDAPPREAEGMTPVDNRVLRYLHGCGTLEGQHFGDKHPTLKGNYWWRRFLPPPPAEKVET